MSSNHKVGYILAEVKQGIIVHQVNAQGVMGGGIALAIRSKWPKVWDDYSALVKPQKTGPGWASNYVLGHMGRVIFTEVDSQLMVASIVGQQFYGREAGRCYTMYPALEQGFHTVKNVAKNNMLDVHYPLIGCGLAGGDWTIVSSLIDRQLDGLNHTLWELPK